MPAARKSIPDDFIDQLLARVDIVDVIDRRVPLQKKGREYQARCPFHDEKTPSFTVSPAKQFYHCFGCGEHGTAIGFLMKYANLGFVEAIEELAAGIGVSVPSTGRGAPTGATNELFDALKDAAAWFQQQLKTPQGKAAIAYLKSRGLDGKTAATFGVGYAPDTWDGLLRAFTARREQLIKTGLVTTSDGGKVYDRFRGRVMFPIEDTRGRVVGFGGRVIGDGEPKYLNSPDTPLFHKGAELYNLHRARRAIGKADCCIVVEGYMDVVSLAQFGVDNAVATLGTATTRTLEQLFRLAPKVVFCFDGDRAGRAAAWKAMQQSLPGLHAEREVRFLLLGEGEDPDTLVRAEGGEAFQQRVAGAQPLSDFLFATLSAQVDLANQEGKAQLVKLAAPLLSTLPAGALREEMFAQLSRLSFLSRQQIEIETARADDAPRRESQKSRAPAQLSNMAIVTSLLLQYPHLGKVESATQALHGVTLKGAEVLQKLLRLIADADEPNTARLLEGFRGDKVHAYLEKLAAHPHHLADDVVVAYFTDSAARLAARQIERRRLDLLEKSRQSNLDEAEKRELVALLANRAG